MPFDSVTSFPQIGSQAVPSRADETALSKRPGLAVTAVALGALAVSAFLGATINHLAVTSFFLIAQLTVVSIVIWQACDPFAEAAQWLGHRLQIPGSVRGATLDAIASSLPELFAGVFFVVVAFTTLGGDRQALATTMGNGYAAALATCAGSAVYNMILIPAFCALVISSTRKEQPTIEVSSSVLARDGSWFLGCEVLLVWFLFQPALHWWMAVALIGLYTGYVLVLHRETTKYRAALAGGDQEVAGEEADDIPGEATLPYGLGAVPLTLASAWLVILVCTAVAAAACYWLVEITHATSYEFGIPAFFVAVILAAAASSVPDTFLSIGAARRGDDDGAVANAFGSNIFDICICLSVPLLLAIALNGGQPIQLTENGEPLAGLLGIRLMLITLTVITLAVMWHKRNLTRNNALLLCALYVSFVAYAVAGSLGLAV